MILEEKNKSHKKLGTLNFIWGRFKDKRFEALYVMKNLKTKFSSVDQVQ